MASRTEMIMAGFDANVSEEERKMQERIEKSKTIRSIDNLTAMASGAEMGYNLGTAVNEVGTSIQDMRGKFQARRAMKQKFMEQDHIKGLSKKEQRVAWKRGGVKEDGTEYRSGKASRRELIQGWEQDKMTKDELVSMYLQGTNVTQTKVVNGTEVEVISDSDSGFNGNIKGYPGVDTTSDSIAGAIVQDIDGSSAGPIPGVVGVGGPSGLGFRGLLGIAKRIKSRRDRKKEEKNEGGGGAG